MFQCTCLRSHALCAFVKFLSELFLVSSCALSFHDEGKFERISTSRESENRCIFDEKGKHFPQNIKIETLSKYKQLDAAIHNLGIVFSPISSHVLTFSRVGRLFFDSFLTQRDYVFGEKIFSLRFSEEVNKVICDYVQKIWFVT